MQRIATARELLAVPVCENGEPMVNLAQLDAPNLLLKYEQQDMRPYCGEEMWARAGVADRLSGVLDELRSSELGLQLVYAYRHPEIQEKYFNRRLAVVRRQYDLPEEELIERAHLFSAYPLVAGHPTGGAVDVKLLDKSGASLDFGTEISDFTRPELIPTFCEGLTKQQKENRGLLLNIMCSAGFAPFLGEWWHFSYGDREWAWYCGKKRAIYAQVKFAPNPCT